MQETINPYQNFNTYCLRTPLLQIEHFFTLTKPNKTYTNEILEYFNDPVTLESIFITSLDLYKELKKWQEGKLAPSKIEKLATSLLKYASRMSSRCTPFGIFAGCSSGEFSNTTTITPTTSKNHKRYTRLDMHYLVNLTHALSNNSDIKNKLKWYPNTSLYEVGNQYRYIEYAYFNKKRNYSIEAVSKSEYIESILTSAILGKTIHELANTIVDNEITLQEAIDFVDLLIKNQLLVSELEPSITGGNYLPTLISTLKKIKSPEFYIILLTKLSSQLNSIDKKLGNSIENYIEILKTIEAIEVKSDPKFLFQTDLFLQTQSNQLDTQVVSDLKKGLVLLNKITSSNKNNPLQKFKAAFIARYEDREVPLVQVLDNEMGISYLQEIKHSVSDPLLDDLLLPKKDLPQEKLLSWNPFMDILFEKVQQIKVGQTLELYDSDFNNFEINWNDLPPTMSTMIEVINLKGEQKLVVNSFGGASAGNLLGRFCHGDQKLNDLVTDIIKKEKESAPNAIHAEIIHLPESRTGNILQRPIFRDYEIPYLGTSKLPIERQIPITDLLLSVKRNRLYLRSKKHNKEVVPHLTNAHNYKVNALPIYHFLCDLQTQDLRKSIYFDWGSLTTQFTYLPRVTYQNLILAKAQWRFQKEIWSVFNKITTEQELLLEELENWKSKYQLPQFVQLIEGDNSLLINLKNMTSFQMLLQSVKNKPEVILEEFLFTEDAVVKNESESFTNQIVVAFYKNKNDYIEY